MSKRVYTDKHITWLMIGYRLWNARDLARESNARFGMKKTKGQIKSALQNHGIVCGRAPEDRLISRSRIFTEEQVQFLRDHYAGRSIPEMTIFFNSRFGTDFTKRQIKTAVHNRHIISGIRRTFPPGHRPWNTGTKGQGLTSANRTSFRKGNVPANRKPLGSERISKDGYIEVKIAERDPYTGFPTRYRLKHVHIWEQAHGPVLKGTAVAFRDGDKTRCELANLMLVSRAELLALNQRGYKETPAPVKPSVLALAKLEVKMWGRGKGLTGFIG